MMVRAALRLAAARRRPAGGLLAVRHGTAPSRRRCPSSSRRSPAAWSGQSASVTSRSRSPWRARADSFVLADSKGQLRALRATDGKELWRADAKSALSAGVGSDGRFAAVVTRDQDGGRLRGRQRTLAPAPEGAGADRAPGGRRARFRARCRSHGAGLRRARRRCACGSCAAPATRCCCRSRRADGLQGHPGGGPGAAAGGSRPAQGHAALGRPMWRTRAARTRSSAWPMWWRRWCAAAT